MNLRRKYAPLALVLSFGCGREKPADVADAAMGASTADPSAVCVDDQPALAALPPDAGACGADGGAPAADPGRPLGFGFPEGDDVLPAGVAFLTFDDGPSDWTAEILDILAAKGVHATFFINAKNLKGPAGLDGSYTDAAGKTAVYRDLVKREVDEGHVIGNHTVDHKDLASLGVSDAAGELDLNEQLINAALVKTGGTPRVLTLIRPPFGSPFYHHAPLPADPVAAADTVGRLIANRGLDVMWTIDSSDSLEWAQGESYTRAPGGVTIDATVSYADKVARVESTVLTDPAIAAHEGAIILVHDTHNATRDAAAAIIDGLRAAGYTFGTIEELAQQRWGHPSLALTPGPLTFAPCVPQSDWGCAGASDAAHSVCGRLWRAYESADGASKLGAPLGAPSTDATTGVTSQSFEHGSLALHPETAAPCSATLSTTTPP